MRFERPSAFDLVTLSWWNLWVLFIECVRGSRIIHGIKCLFNCSLLQIENNGRHFAHDISKCVFVNENLWNSNVSSKCVPLGLTGNMSSLFQIMAWYWIGDKPLLEQICSASYRHLNSIMMYCYQTLHVVSLLIHQNWITSGTRRPHLEFQCFGLMAFGYALFIIFIALLAHALLIIRIILVALDKFSKVKLHLYFLSVIGCDVALVVEVLPVFPIWSISWLPVIWWSPESWNQRPLYWASSRIFRHKQQIKWANSLNKVRGISMFYWRDRGWYRRPADYIDTSLPAHNIVRI